MKKISHLSTISSVIVLAFIVPQIAFAAWWNPISWFNGWSFFHRTDTKTQVLETRIQELEAKLASSTPPATTAVPVVNNEVKKVVPVKAAAPTKPVPSNAEKTNVVPQLPKAVEDPQIKIEKCKIAAQMSIDASREFVLETAELGNTNCINTAIEVIDDTLGTAARTPETYNSILSACRSETQNKLNILRTQLYNQKYLACLSGN